ncbi:MAG: DUF2007 domain-containing protein [Flavobacteriales bacterium]|nr:DUF2007 domain-containing protein [Flavobacteriales bacterium]
MGEWVNIFSDTNLQRVQIVMGLLDHEGIQSVFFNQQDSAYPSVGEINLMVNPEDVIRAKRIVEKFQDE